MNIKNCTTVFISTELMSENICELYVTENGFSLYFNIL